MEEELSGRGAKKCYERRQKEGSKRGGREKGRRHRGGSGGERILLRWKSKFLSLQ